MVQQVLLSMRCCRSAERVRKLLAVMNWLDWLLTLSRLALAVTQFSLSSLRPCCPRTQPSISRQQQMMQPSITSSSSSPSLRQEFSFSMWQLPMNSPTISSHSSPHARWSPMKCTCAMWYRVSARTLPLQPGWDRQLCRMVRLQAILKPRWMVRKQKKLVLSSWSRADSRGRPSVQARALSQDWLARISLSLSQACSIAWRARLLLLSKESQYRSALQGAKGLLVREQGRGGSGCGECLGSAGREESAGGVVVR